MSKLLTQPSSSTQSEDFDPNFRPKPLSASQTGELKNEYTKIKKLFDQFDKEFVSSKDEFFYLLSTRWLNKWKQFVSYDQQSKGKEPDRQYFGQIVPGEMNRDIILNLPDAIEFSGQENVANVFLKDQIQAERDYIIISEAIWKEFRLRYNGTEIKRPVIVLPNGTKRVEARLKSFNVIFTTNQLLRNIDLGKIKKFTCHRIQYPSQAPLKDLKKDLLKTLSKDSAGKYISQFHKADFSKPVFDDENVRLWKLDPQQNPEQAFEYFKEICGKSTLYEYKIPFQGTYMEKFSDKKLEDVNIAESDTMFVEIKEELKGWNYSGPDVPMTEKCDSCMKYSALKYHCACGKVAYCSEECKQKDKKFHLIICSKAEEDEEEEEKNQVELQETPQSMKGLTGLQNLGNTCFMNSGLQCLSNFKELTEYFLSGRFQSEINETNPLGTKGKLAKTYANLMKNLWYGTSKTFSPWSFKRTLSKFQPMFSGYQQHDSQEFLNFLLDGLHEDLNRVKDKPFVETLESNNSNDENIGKQSWQNHLKRNQSVLVDLLHGQFKSQITCPDCKRVSVTYDPFMSISVPIPNKKKKEIEFFYVFHDLKQKPYKIVLPFDTADHTVKDLKAQIAKLVNRDPNSFNFVLLSQTSKEVVGDEGKTSTNEIYKKGKQKNLFSIEHSPEDLKLGAKLEHVDFVLTIKSTNYFGRVVRKPFTFVRTMSFEPNSTARQVYLKVFKTFRFLYDEYLPEPQRQNWLKLSDEEAFREVIESKDFKNKHFRIYLISNARGTQECYFCGDKRCENCELECSNQKRLDQLLTRIKDKSFQLSMELCFQNMPTEIELGRLNTCIDLQKKLREEKGDDASKLEPKEEKKEPEVQIYDCFRQFEQPEQLGEDNQWYCSKCKKHQQAIKKMEIYKAPPILIIHLKRFKESATKYFPGKLEAMVNFPIQDLDLSEFVKNHELPMDYPISLPPRTKDQQEAQKPLAENNKKPSNSKPAHGATLNNNRPRGNQPAEETKGSKSTKKNKLAYDLFGVVNHYGSTGFGHYTAFAKNWKSGSWDCYDDSHVTPQDPKDVCTPAAYVLFYKRKDWNFKPTDTAADTLNVQKLSAK